MSYSQRDALPVGATYDPKSEGKPTSRAVRLTKEGAQGPE